MAISMYQYRSLSMLSESASIMLPLYIRGVGMAFIFTPLSSVAISHIDPKKMARASGIINVVRQIGGSFGVALFGTMLIRQQAIYSNTFGQSMDRYSAAFKHAMAGLTNFAVRATGGTVSTGASKAQALLIANMYTQSFVAAIGRIFLVASIVIAAALVPVLLLKESHRKRTKHAGSASAE